MEIIYLLSALSYPNFFTILLVALAISWANNAQTNGNPQLSASSYPSDKCNPFRVESVMKIYFINLATCIYLHNIFQIGYPYLIIIVGLVQFLLI